jgi:hypothetical protein
MKSLSARYKKYYSGGSMGAQRDAGMGLQSLGAMATPMIADAVMPGAGQIVSQVGQIGAGLVDAISPADKYGRQSKTAALTKGMFQGGTIGMLGAAFSHKRNQRAGDALEADERFQERQANLSMSQARIAGDPSLVHGSLRASYYANGGHLNVAGHKATGGSIEPLSSTAAEVVGPSHEAGGVKIPGAELEGKETTNGDYVFSERLGFAQLHKPIAKAIGRIETKAMTPERVNSLNLLKSKENDLKLTQEYVRQQLDLN